MDTIDFNKHDIDIFINLTKIVRYGRHWDKSCNEWRLLLIIYFDGNFPYAKLHPYSDDYKNMSTLNTYCGILSTCHNYKKIEFFVQVRSKITQSKQKFYNPLIGLQHIIKFSLQWLISFNQQMKKNGLLQNFFYDFLKIQVTNWVREIQLLVTFENQSSMTKVTSAS